MHEQTVTALNALLRGELRSVKCYQRVLRRLSRAAPARPAVEECLASHQGRAARLVMEISRRGGEPVDSAGLLGRTLAVLAALLALAWFRLAARLLKTVETRGINRYDKSWNSLDERARDFLTSCLFPQQVLSHQSIALLGDSIHSFAETPTP